VSDLIVGYAPRLDDAIQLQVADFKATIAEIVTY